MERGNLVRVPITPEGWHVGIRVQKSSFTCSSYGNGKIHLHEDVSEAIEVGAVEAEVVEVIEIIEGYRLERMGME
jgi:hypothetical protein